jgi:Tat protein translocase TatB subunit
MFGIGMPELMLIFVLALLVFGPKELPRIARTLGKAMAELRRASDELRDGIQREIELAERAETPPASPEVPHSTTPSEGTVPPPESQMISTLEGATTGTSERPPGTVAGEVPTMPTIPATEHVGETPSREMIETTSTSPPPEAGDGKQTQEAPGEHRPEAKATSSAPTQPVETRNA